MSLAQHTRRLCPKTQVSMGSVFTRNLSLQRRTKNCKQRVGTRNEPSRVGSQCDHRPVVTHFQSKHLQIHSGFFLSLVGLILINYAVKWKLITRSNILQCTVLDSFVTRCRGYPLRFNLPILPSKIWTRINE